MQTPVVTSLRDVTLPEALVVVRRERGTGILHVATGGEERRLLFVDGELRAAQSTREDEKLGSWLVHRNCISEEVKALALLKVVAGEAPSLGHVRRCLGFLDQTGLDRELQALAIHIVTRAVVDVGSPERASWARCCVATGSERAQGAGA